MRMTLIVIISCVLVGVPLYRTLEFVDDNKLIAHRISAIENAPERFDYGDTSILDEVHYETVRDRAPSHGEPQVVLLMVVGADTAAVQTVLESLSRLKSSTGTRVTVEPWLAVASNTSTAALVELLKTREPSRVLRIRDPALYSVRTGINKTPSLFVVKRPGSIRAMSVGVPPRSTIEHMLASALRAEEGALVYRGAVEGLLTNPAIGVVADRSGL